MRASWKNCRVAPPTTDVGETAALRAPMPGAKVSQSIWALRCRRTNLGRRSLQVFVEPAPHFMEHVLCGRWSLRKLAWAYGVAGPSRHQRGRGLGLLRNLFHKPHVTGNCRKNERAASVHNHFDIRPGPYGVATRDIYPFSDSLRDQKQPGSASAPACLDRRHGIL